MIKLNDGKTVSGTVTPDTEIECESTMSQTMQSDDGGGDQVGANQGPSGGEDQGEDQGDDDQGEANQPSCTASNLTPGTFVRGAELELSSAGAVWEKIDLIL